MMASAFDRFIFANNCVLKALRHLALPQPVSNRNMYIMAVSRNIENVSYKLLKLGKEVYHLSRPRKVDEPKLITFIVGCQRSGTSLMNRIFEKDFGTKVYGERSKLSSLDLEKRLRLNPLDLVKRDLEKDKVGLVILKPLVESQNIVDLLNYFPGSKSLWMFRGYKQVVSSNLKRWGMRNGINNLRPIVKEETNNWRSQRVSTETRSLICKYFHEDMNPYDAAALFWLARNRLFFELDLQRNPNITLCKYEDLILHPHTTMRKVYAFLGKNYPSDRIVSMVNANSLGSGKEVWLSPDVENLCSNMLDDLDRAYRPISS